MHALITPVSKCEHPKMFFSKRAKKEIYVSCGKCLPCRMARQARWAERIKKESQDHLYTQVIYLDYNDAHIPKYDFDDDPYFLVDNTPRLQEYYKNNPGLQRIDLRELHFHHEYERDYVIDRLNGSVSSLPHPSVYDIQIFKKRLATKICREVTGNYGSFRSAIVAEIGSTTFRPHYHGVIWFDDERILQALKRFVPECWTDSIGNPLGDAHVEAERGNFASYISKYITKPADIPEIYEMPGFKPFFLTSRHPPIGTLCTGARNRYIFDSASPVKVEISGSGDQVNVQVFPIGQSLEARLYPKCPLYSQLSEHDRFELYKMIFDPDGLVYESYEAFKTDLLNKALRKTVEDTLFDFRDFGYNLTHLKADLDQGRFVWNNSLKARLVKLLCQDFTSECSFHMLYSCGLRIQKQKLDFCVSFNDYVRRIFEYYDYKKPQYQLRQFYRQMEQKLFENSDFDLRFFYPLTYYRSGFHPEDHPDSLSFFQNMKDNYFESTKMHRKNGYFESRRLKEYDYNLYCLIKKYLYAKECNENDEAAA